MFDRFTRDEISSWVWWPATMILVVLLVLTFPGENRALEQRRDQAAERAWSLTVAVLAPTLADSPQAPIQGDLAEDLATLAAERILAASWSEAIRIWAADSTLLWSSDREDPVGSAGGLNDEAITSALSNLAAARQVLSERDLDGRPAEATFSAYAPFSLGGELVVAQFEAAEATLLGDVRGDWLGYRIVLGLAALFTLALAVGSMREPIARIGARVPFYPTSVPRGMDVIDLDTKRELERAGANARERVSHMHERLQESEELRLKAEGDLQRALSQLANQPGRPARSVIPRHVEAEIVPASPEPVPQPATTSGSEGLALVPPLDGPATPASAPAAPTAPVEPAATRTAPHEPAPATPTAAPADTGSAAQEPQPRRRSDRSHPSRRREPASSGLEPTRQRRPRRLEDQGAPTEPGPIAPAAETGRGADATASTQPPREKQPPAPVPEDVVVIPPAATADDETDHEARDVLERLVEPVAVGVVPADDPSELRAKLARTAARKKPGSRHEERFEHPDEPASS